MKKLLLILLCLPMIGFSQKRYHVNDIQISSFHQQYGFTVYIHYLDNENFELVNGVVYKEYQDEKLEEEISFKNGVMHGLFKRWHENGQLHREVNYYYTNLDGLVQQWYDTGQLELSLSFKNGVMHGLFKEWYENGQLRFNAKYTEGVVDYEQCWNEEENEIKCE